MKKRMQITLPERLHKSLKAASFDESLSYVVRQLIRHYTSLSEQERLNLLMRPGQNFYIPGLSIE